MQCVPAIKSSRRDELPVTLLSGFLGSGKTTLLQHVLRNKAGLKCAVLVNDVAKLNIDASLVRKSDVLSMNDKLVELENGCVCCSLADAMVEQVAELAAKKEFEYVVIESTGVADPSETASALCGVRVDSDGKEHGLMGEARLDTTVTVIDASQAMDRLASMQTVKQAAEHDDHGGDEQACDESCGPMIDDRYVADLLVAQAEFADVIVLNKVDLLSAEEVKRITAFIASLNPAAKILPTSFGQVELASILDTKLFSLENAKKGAGWMRPRHDHDHEDDHSTCIGKGLKSFIYTARAPFHPQRLFDFLQEHFIVQEPSWRASFLHNDLNAAIVRLKRSAAAARHAQRTMAPHVAAQLLKAAIDAAGAAAATAAAAMEVAQTAVEVLPVTHEPVLKAASVDEDAGAMRARARASAFGDVLRSKGVAWIAGAARSDHSVEWSSAGNVMRVGTGGVWYCMLPEDKWSGDPEIRKAIRRDFAAETGDRRQEIVFLGMALNEEALRERLDACLCTQAELQDLSSSDDCFAKWPSVADFMPDSDSDSDSDSEEGSSDSEDDEDFQNERKRTKLSSSD